MHAKIFIQGVRYYAYHGVLPEEQQLGQEFMISLELDVELLSHGQDRLEETVDYRRAVEVVRQVMEGERRLLLETLAGEITDKLLNLSRVHAAKVRVSKPHPPIPGVQGGVTVEICRCRGD